MMGEDETDLIYFAHGCIVTFVICLLIYIFLNSYNYCHEDGSCIGVTKDQLIEMYQMEESIAKKQIHISNFANSWEYRSDDVNYAETVKNFCERNQDILGVDLE